MNGIDAISATLKQGKAVIGSYVSSSDPTVAETLALAGFDFVWVDAEHAPLDRKDVLAHAIAASAGGACVFVRVPWTDPVLVKPFLEMGIDAVIFPYIRTVDDAKLAVQTVLYPPDGVRGYGPVRAIRYGLETPAEYVSGAARMIWKILQIETKECLQDLEQIVQVPGVDAFLIGPMDLSASLGHLGEMDHPEVAAAFDHAARVVTGQGIPLAVATGYVPDSFTRWLERGVRIFSLGADYAFLSSAAAQLHGDARRAADEYARNSSG